MSRRYVMTNRKPQEANTKNDENPEIFVSICRTEPELDDYVPRALNKEKASGDRMTAHWVTLNSNEDSNALVFYEGSVELTQQPIHNLLVAVKNELGEHYNGEPTYTAPVNDQILEAIYFEARLAAYGAVLLHAAQVFGPGSSLHLHAMLRPGTEENTR